MSGDCPDGIFNLDASMTQFPMVLQPLGSLSLPCLENHGVKEKHVLLQPKPETPQPQTTPNPVSAKTQILHLRSATPKYFKHS